MEKREEEGTRGKRGQARRERWIVVLSPVGLETSKVGHYSDAVGSVRTCHREGIRWFNTCHSHVFAIELFSRPVKTDSTDKKLTAQHPPYTSHPRRLHVPLSSPLASKNSGNVEFSE